MALKNMMEESEEVLENDVHDLIIPGLECIQLSYQQQLKAKNCLTHDIDTIKKPKKTQTKTKQNTIQPRK